MDRGAAAGKPVTIHVESFNPALRLYRRRGFEHADTSGVYFLMRWTPPQVKTASYVKPPASRAIGTRKMSSGSANPSWVTMHQDSSGPRILQIRLAMGV